MSEILGENDESSTARMRVRESSASAQDREQSPAGVLIVGIACFGAAAYSVGAAVSDLMELASA